MFNPSVNPLFNPSVYPVVDPHVYPVLNPPVYILFKSSVYPIFNPSVYRYFMSLSVSVLDVHVVLETSLFISAVITSIRMFVLLQGMFCVCSVIFGRESFWA